MVGRAGLRVATEMNALDDEESWTYLRANRLGRVGISVAGRLHIFPVNYAVGGHSIVFRTAAGSKLEHGPGQLTCFEVDGYDHGSLEGWSVMAFGRLEDITDATDEESAALRGLQIQPVAPGPRMHFIAMRVDEVTGRRFTAGWLVPGAYLG